MAASIGISSVVSASTTSDAGDFQSTLEQAEELYKQNKHQEIYELLQPLADQGNDEILWRLARASFELLKTPPNNTKEKAEEAFSYVSKALEKNDKNHNVHRWYGILLNRKAQFAGVKEQLLTAFTTKEHFLKAVELNPKDSTAIHLLGSWCFTLAEMPWYQRKIASALFATPPEASFEEALQFFEKAEEVDPGFYSSNLLYLAKTYLKVNRKDDAIHALEKLRTYSLKTQEDHEVHKEGMALLKKLGVKS